MTTATKNKLCNTSELKVGDKWSRQSFGKVIAIIVQHEQKEIHVENESGVQWMITHDLFEEEFRVHDQFESEETKTRTELAELCMENPRVVMTICFLKQTEPNDVADTLLDKLQEGDIAVGDLTQRKWRKIVRDTMADNIRVLVGRHACVKDAGGRIYFVDMEAEPDNNIRRVDPRNIRWMIVNNIRYTVKK